MRFIPIDLPDAYLVELDCISDERGFFARTYCQDEFKEKGLDANLVQCSISYNKVRGTLRGMHFQIAPHAEAKLVRCTRGSIYDVIIDLRPDSQTFTNWFGVELNAENRKSLYVPAGFAHGFITRQDNSEVLYQMSEFFHSECASGVRWNDPAFGIHWPEPVRIISTRDQNYPDFNL
jgi:dTDP-4-dehydrorhamnose 3,5-epimerase